jgi:hypothetical protein
MTSSHCKGCGQPIMWRTTPNGKPMPLEVTYTRAPVEATGTYVLTSKNGCLPFDLRAHGRTAFRYMNHWATCPVADSFKEKRP